MAVSKGYEKGLCSPRFISINDCDSPNGSTFHAASWKRRTNVSNKCEGNAGKISNEREGKPVAALVLTTLTWIPSSLETVIQFTR